MFYIKPVKQEQMYMNPPISMFHDVVSLSEMAAVKRLARPRVNHTPRLYVFVRPPLSRCRTYTPKVAAVRIVVLMLHIIERYFKLLKTTLDSVNRYMKS